MATFEVHLTPSHRSLVKRRKSDLNLLIEQLGGERMDTGAHTAYQMASEVMRLFRALPPDPT